jgi:hypothetical protein
MWAETVLHTESGGLSGGPYNRIISMSPSSHPNGGADSLSAAALGRELLTALGEDESRQEAFLRGRMVPEARDSGTLSQHLAPMDSI